MSAAKTTDPRAGERGQALALFTGGLMALLVAVGLVLDSGIAFVVKRDAQNAADLAALAGTQLVADYHLGDSVSGAQVHAAIDATVRENGCTPGGGAECTWTADYVVPSGGYTTSPVAAVADTGSVPANAQGVEVDITRRPDTFFLRLIGQADWTVTADATALTSQVEDIEAGVMLPIAFDPGRTLTHGERYLFSEGKDAPGNFSWLSWFDDTSTPELISNVCTPRNPEYTFPEYIPAGPGNMNSSEVRACLDTYIGQEVYIPLWDECSLGAGVTGTGSHVEFCIVGVALFVLGGYDANPAIDNLWGTFQKVSHITGVPANFSGPPCVHGSPGCDSATTFIGLIE